MDWKLEFCHGDDKDTQEVSEGETISALEYDSFGEYLAFGDKAGRVTVLQRKKVRDNGQKKDSVVLVQCAQFQSHEAEFDYLKSVEIEEKINQIQWLKQRTSAHLLLTTNDKTVKLWEIFTSSCKAPSAPSADSISAKRPSSSSNSSAVATPLPSQCRTSFRRSFANAHAYHINSISLCSDSETFISSDDLRINMWHLEHKESMNIVDIKPANMEDLTEVITSATFHPSHCSLFLYSTSKGTMKMGDLRESSVIRHYCKTFEMEEEPSNKTFFSEIISSISDCKFGNDYRFILSRDYLTLKIWDINMEKRPLKVINLHEPLRARLCDVYENDCIFDKFECRWSGDTRIAFTGSYKNYFKVTDVTTVTSSCSPKKSTMTTQTYEAIKKKPKKSKLPSLPKFTRSSTCDEDYDKTDFNKKVLHVAVHPFEYEVAVATVSNVHVFRCPQ